MQDNDKEAVFKFLDSLRESGATTNNMLFMFGVGPYIQHEFGVSISKARSLLMEWMETFAKRHSIEETS